MRKHQDKIVIGLGEVLWDVFPEASYFGGAPVNFACHAAALGAKVFVVSAVGKDLLGRDAIKELCARKVSIEYLQSDSPYRTGTVDVVTDGNGQASYRFAENTAWDHIEWSDRMVSLAKCCDTVCFGSLAQRNSVSRQTIHNFLQATRIDCLRIFDVNLRQDFYSREVVERSLEFASVLKLNEDELPTVLQLLDAPSGSHQENIHWLSRTYSLSHVALTRGAAGSMLYADNVFDERESPKSKSSIPLEQATHLPPLLLLGC